MIERKDVYVQPIGYDQPSFQRPVRDKTIPRLFRSTTYGDLPRVELSHTVAQTTFTDASLSIARLAVSEGILPQKTDLHEVIDGSLERKLAAGAPLGLLETQRLMARADAVPFGINTVACLDLYNSLATLTTQQEKVTNLAHLALKKDHIGKEQLQVDLALELGVGSRLEINIGDPDMQHCTIIREQEIDPGTKPPSPRKKPKREKLRLPIWEPPQIIPGAT